MGCLGTLGFSMLFNIRGKNLLWGTLGGLVDWGVYLAVFHICGNDFISSFFASMAVTIYAECMARKRKTPVTVFLVAALIPLIPGGALYRTMGNAVTKNWSMFIQEGGYTFLFALSIAVGIICATVVFQMIWMILRYRTRYRR